MTNGKPANARAPTPPAAPGTKPRAKFIAVANMKGGVGKTTTVVGLAEFLAIEKKASVLVVDLDQQASASLCIVGDALLAQLIQQGRTIDAYLKLRVIDEAQTQLGTRIRRGTCNVTHGGKPVFLNLIPASQRLRIIERELLIALTRRRQDFNGVLSYLRNLFEGDFSRLRADFDYVLFDCAPGISALTETAINASDLVIIPTIPDRMSAFGLLAFLESVLHKSVSPSAVAHARVLFTRVQNTSQHKAVMKHLRARYGQLILQSEINQSADLADGIYPELRPAGAAPFIPTLNQRYGGMAIQQFKALVKDEGLEEYL